MKLVMGLNPLNLVLGSLAPQFTSPEQRYFQQIVRSWPAIVGAAVSAQTQPIAVQNGVLQVATASSVWAQNLMFQRVRILQKLNAELPKPLTDLRFSPAQWQIRPLQTPTASEELAAEWHAHPSRLSVPTSDAQNLDAQSSDTQNLDAQNLDAQSPDGMNRDRPSDPLPTAPHHAFHLWADRVRSRSQNLPVCPTCQCPTPSGELDRWRVCSICAAKTWHS